MKDEYGYKKMFKSYDIDQFIEAFNEDAGHNGWVRARGFFLAALREALLATGLDCSDFITGEGMSMRYKIKRDGGRIVPVHGFYKKSTVARAASISPKMKLTGIGTVGRSGNAKSDISMLPVDPEQS